MTTRTLARAARAALAALALAAARPDAAPGQAPAAQTPAVQDHGTPTARATRAAGPIRLDGRPIEPAWAAAEPITTFTQTDPEEGRPASQPTEVRILYDDEALYIGAVLRDTGPIARRLARRDTYMPDSDWFGVALDTYHDHRTAYRFMVNPAGVRADELLSPGNEERGDDSWDPVWDVAVEVTDSGWTVEMRIPLSQLRFGRRETQVWGIQIEREIARRQESAVFAFTPKSERGGIARYGHLTGLEGLRPGPGLEVLPYLVGRAEYRDVPGGDGAEARPELRLAVVAAVGRVRRVARVGELAGLDLDVRDAEPPRALDGDGVLGRRVGFAASDHGKHAGGAERVHRHLGEEDGVHSAGVADAYRPAGPQDLCEPGELRVERGPVKFRVHPCRLAFRAREASPVRRPGQPRVPARRPGVGGGPRPPGRGGCLWAGGGRRG